MNSDGKQLLDGVSSAVQHRVKVVDDLNMSNQAAYTSMITHLETLATLLKHERDKVKAAELVV